MRGILAPASAVVIALAAGCGPLPCESDGSCAEAELAGVPVARAPALEVEASWAAPVPSPGAISSTFGPRWKASAEREDFHLGVDFVDALGTPVLAIGDGVVESVFAEGSEAFPNGGNVVIVRHELPAPTVFHDQRVTRFYAVYLHLDTIGVPAGAAVTRGERLGTMGSSGDTDFVHLHFETRVQTTCSLPYQSSHPHLACATGFDPHVHPFLFVGGANADRLDVTTLPVDDGYAIRYRATRGDLDLDVIESDLGTIGFSARTGIDARSQSRLDDFDYGFLRIAPRPFGTSSSELVYELYFRRPPAFLELRDIRGRGLRFEPQASAGGLE